MKRRDGLVRLFARQTRVGPGEVTGCGRLIVPIGDAGVLDLDAVTAQSLRNALTAMLGRIGEQAGGMPCPR